MFRSYIKDEVILPRYHLPNGIVIPGMLSPGQKLCSGQHPGDRARRCRRWRDTRPWHRPRLHFGAQRQQGGVRGAAVRRILRRTRGERRQIPTADALDGVAAPDRLQRRQRRRQSVHAAAAAAARDRRLEGAEEVEAEAEADQGEQGREEGEARAEHRLDQRRQSLLGGCDLSPHGHQQHAGGDLDGEPRGLLQGRACRSGRELHSVPMTQGVSIELENQIQSLT